MHWLKRTGYIIFVGGLTASAASACYWQSQRYIQARDRWDVIRRQLNKENPQRLEEIFMEDLYPFKYVAVKGSYKEGYQRVDRMRNSRMGYLVVRALQYKNKNGEKQQIAALEGWCDPNYEFTGKESSQKQLRGILREKEKKDYVHTRFKQQDLERFKMSTYIDLQTILSRMQIKPSYLSQNYYLQVLKPLDSTDDEEYFPYQYSVDNFELPYLTPDKHLSYATFWGCSTLVGLFAIFKAIKLK